MVAWGSADAGGTANFVIRNNHAEKGGFGTLRGEATADHNRENVPAGEFVSVEATDFRLKGRRSPSVDAGALIKGINEGVKDGRPDLGAYEYGDAGTAWKAGSAVPPTFLP